MPVEHIAAAPPASVAAGQGVPSPRATSAAPAMQLAICRTPATKTARRAAHISVHENARPAIEHQQDKTELGEKACALARRDEAKAERADHYAREQGAEDCGQTHAREKRDRERGSADQRQRFDHRVSFTSHEASRARGTSS